MKNSLFCLLTLIFVTSCITVRINPGTSTYISANTDDFKVTGMDYSPSFKAKNWSNNKKNTQTNFSYSDFQGKTSLNIAVYKATTIQFLHDYKISKGDLTMEVRNENDSVLYRNTFSGKERMQFSVHFQEPGEYSLNIIGALATGSTLLSWK